MGQLPAAGRCPSWASQGEPQGTQDRLELLRGLLGPEAPIPDH